MAQRRTAAGFTETRRLSGSTTASSRTRSSPPQSPGPLMSGMLGAIAIASVSASRQADGGGGRRPGGDGLLGRLAGRGGRRLCGPPALPASPHRASAGRGFGTVTRPVRPPLSVGGRFCGCRPFRLGHRRIGRTRLRQRHRWGNAAARRGLGRGSPNRSPHGPCDQAPASAPQQVRVCTQSSISAVTAVTMMAAAPQAEAATRPFAACFLRAKVHGNSVKTCGKR